MEYFAFLHGSVLFPSTYCSWLTVSAKPSGKHLLSSWEQIFLDIEVAKNAGSCVVEYPQNLQATCKPTADRDYMRISHINYQDNFWVWKIGMRLTRCHGLLQSHNMHFTGRKRWGKICRSRFIFNLSMGMMVARFARMESKFDQLTKSLK